MKALLYRNIVTLVYVLLLPLVGFAQRAGDLDRSFNYGRGENYAFNYGNGTRNPLVNENGQLKATVIQPDGKIIIGGEFTSYNGTAINNIARLNADGSLDPTFNLGAGAFGAVLTIRLQSDAKIIIGGSFNAYNGVTRNKIARLNADGSLDTSFNPGTGADWTIQTIAEQADGKIIIGGDFTSFNGTSRNRIARLNADGSLDVTFNPGTGANSWVSTTAVQADGKIIIGGVFTTFNGTTKNKIARLNANGSLDPTFNRILGELGGVNTIALQNDGKIIIGGRFTFSLESTPNEGLARLNADGSIDSTFSSSGDRVINIALQPDGKIILAVYFPYSYGNNVIRLNANGVLDPTFNIVTGAIGTVWTTAWQADGKIIIGGEIRTFNNTIRHNIARLNSDGGLDASFNPEIGANNHILTSVIQSDGKIIIGGEFTSYNGTTINKIARLNYDGTLDTTFNVGTSEIEFVNTIILQPNGKLIIGGDIYSFNGTRRIRVARLNSDGSLDVTFDPGSWINSAPNTIALQPDGKLIIGGNFSYSFTDGTFVRYFARLNGDGSIDNTFTGRASLNNPVNTIALQADGKIIIGGVFTSYNGTIRNRIARLNSNGSLDATFNPEIGANGVVHSIAIQPDRKIIIGGYFASFNSTAMNLIARLNADGSLDTTFNPGTEVNTRILTTALQPDGKLIISGDFTSFNGITRNRIARLNLDGSLDTNFNFGTGANYVVRTISRQPDGKLIIGGSFTGYNNLSTPYLARIHGVDCPTATPLSVTGNTSFCFGESTILASSQLTGNLWNTGDTSRSIVVTRPGEYTVRTMNNGCTSSFSGIIRITKLDSIITPSVTGINRFCVGGSTVLTSSATNGNLWSTGDTTQSIYVAQAGNYTVRKISNGCTSAVSDTFRVIINSITTPTILGDTNLCNGNPTRLTSSSPTGNLWSTGDTTQFINIAQAGSYSVRVSNSGCFSETSAPFRVVNAGPSPTVINFDTTSNRCLGARLQLTPAGNFAYYQWNTGERTRSLYTRTSGQYSVQVANSDSCFGLPSPPIFIAFDTNWCSVEIFRVGLDSITANVWADYYIWYLDGMELLSSNTLKTIPVQGDGVYTFRAFVGGRTSPLSNPIVITSGKKSLATKFEVYPNPATNKITINTSGSGTLEILNTLGQVVITQPAAATNELNISILAKGVYTVRFSGASKMLVVK